WFRDALAEGRVHPVLSAEAVAAQAELRRKRRARLSGTPAASRTGATRVGNVLRASGPRGSGGIPERRNQMFARIQVKALQVLGVFKEREEGQALVEYALIISLIAVVAITALQLTGTRVTGILNTIANSL